MRTFIEIKEQALEIEFSIEPKTEMFPNSGIYKLKRVDKVGDILEDIVFVDKKENVVKFIVPKRYFDELQLGIHEIDIYRETEKDLGALSLENNVKAEKSLKNLKSRIDENLVSPKIELPTAQLISEDLVPASFVLEFTKALLGKK